MKKRKGEALIIGFDDNAEAVVGRSLAEVAAKNPFANRPVLRS